MKVEDFYSKPSFKMNGETLDGYCHILEDEFNVMSENDEFDTIDLSSFKLHGELCKDVWNGDRIKQEVRLKLLAIADDFFDSLAVDWVEPEDIILTGSLANYNWSKYSDFDLHIVLDFSKVDERTEFVKDYFDSKKNEWNNSHENLKIKDFPVEVYVQDSNEEHASSGIYSLESDEWLTEPKEESMNPIMLDKFYIKQQTFKFVKAIDRLEEKIREKCNKSEAVKTDEALNSLYDKLKNTRKESLDKYGEMGSGNIIYKMLRRLGYLDKILELKSLSYDKMTSI